MTFSILAHDPETGALGGAAATGSLCVGGWVLRGDPRVGMSASQGLSPSTLWGEDVLAEMARGQSATEAVAAVTGADSGRAFRQLGALGKDGRGAVFTGDRNLPAISSMVFPDGVATGNMLADASVIAAMVETYRAASGTFAARLIASLHAARDVGGDTRGLLSAAILVVSENTAPLSLRIDYDEDPLDALDRLHARATSSAYASWCLDVPTHADPERTHA